jgi:serine/threonine-protein kinase PknK
MPDGDVARGDDLPPRYEPQRRLGAGGGGEVWAVRDRVSGRVLALKVLSRSAGEAEIDALVQEAVALSGLEGLGVPRVVAFGALAESGRRFMVRELVEGESLEDVLDDAERHAVDRAARARERAAHRAASGRACCTATSSRRT